jgi:diguanylate cyclase (GGDEF)-like protein
MQEKMNYEMSRFERSGKPFCLILGDIDFFKKVNDTYGHDAGDHILIQISQTLTQHSRKQDFVCRWGGEEFLLLLPETDLEGGIMLAEKIRRQIEKEVQIFNSQIIKITLSQGVSAVDKDQDIKGCIKQADLMLYTAKEQGRNKVCPNLQKLKLHVLDAKQILS